jgi:tRNA pseudouridine55 synthase
MTNSIAPNGWLILNKPVGISSTFAGSKIKRIFKQKKIGHAGTLDPFASGILPLALGEATKTMPFIMNRKKVYEFTLSFGSQTSTDDTEGEVIATSVHIPKQKDIENILHKFIGKISQIPPKYAAIKIDGKAAYKRSRSGEEITMPERIIEIYDLALNSFENNTAKFTVCCRTGTYVRSLGRDIALALSTVGHLSELKRTAVGPFTLKNSISLEKLMEIGNTQPSFTLLPIGAVLDDIPAVTVSMHEVEQIRFGRAIATHSPNYSHVSLWCEKQVVALGHTVDSMFHPDRVFNY